MKWDWCRYHAAAHLPRVHFRTYACVVNCRVGACPVRMEKDLGVLKRRRAVNRCEEVSVNRCAPRLAWWGEQQTARFTGRFTGCVP